jgi:hypothetical protein
MKPAFLFIATLVMLFAHSQQSELEQYKGVYKFGDGSPTPQVEISVQNGSLYAVSSIGSASLSSISKDTFSIPEHDGMIYFSRDKEGKVNAIKVEVNNLVLEGTREAGSLALYRRRSISSLINR